MIAAPAVIISSTHLDFRCYPSTSIFHQTQPTMSACGNTLSLLTSTVISRGAQNVCAERDGWKVEPGRKLQRPHCSGGLIVFSRIASVNLRNAWLTCSFHFSSLLGSSPADCFCCSSEWVEDMETQSADRSASLQDFSDCSVSDF